METLGLLLRHEDVERRRIVNEGRRRLFGRASREIAFVCECADPNCRAAVVLTPEDYDRLRLSAPALVLHAGHEPAENAA